MRILITGGAGFLGSHLCAKLLGEGHNIICIDNFSTGNELNINAFINNPNFSIIKHDTIQPFPNLGHFDQIYNLACPASPASYQLNPINTTKVSFYGTLNCLELAKKTNARFFQASTSEVYGNPTIHPQPESYLGNVNCTGPRACYDEGKRVAESLCFDFNRQHKVDIRVIRIFNTYGPNMDPKDGRVVSNFIVQALQNKPITLNGDGSQTRSFCYVDDLIDGMIRFMNQTKSIGPLNLGNPTELTILELANKVIELTASKSKIVYNSLPEDDPLQRKPDISLAKKFLNWTPRIPLEEGLKKTIPYFQRLVISYSAVSK